MYQAVEKDSKDGKDGKDSKDSGDKKAHITNQIQFKSNQFKSNESEQIQKNQNNFISNKFHNNSKNQNKLKFQTLRHQMMTRRTSKKKAKKNYIPTEDEKMNDKRN